MRAVKGEITSSTPIRLSKAMFLLSRFAASKTITRPDLDTYLKRSIAAFEDLYDVHRDIRDHRKIMYAKVKEAVLQEEEDNNWKKKDKTKDFGDQKKDRALVGSQVTKEHDQMKILEGSGILLKETLGIDIAGTNGVMEVSNKKVDSEEKRKGDQFASVTEDDAMLWKKVSKYMKERSSNERTDELRGDWGGFEEQRGKAVEKKKREVRLEKGNSESLVLVSEDRERRKRKHSDAERGIDVQHERKMKKKLRIVE
ncbi:hypothetical protein HPP92_025870 [Vanilla planifolia]|uniref:Uncharacterized protein n=1 Tax=Vanilla planifolia TaxID=51239 RepID=A0A835U896_VANPL|nr:hypothetical protein HPP92_025870 [Vanilla planifolia]KAG0452092.1 hypothetical protein HPP92_026142 [Vanilla planifolia]